MRLGFFGGTFNPAHLGHLALAQQALCALKLDKLWWLPANPWQKDPQELLAESLRIKSIEQTIVKEPRMAIDTRELSRSGLSYSIDTVKELARQYPNDERFYLIGADQWENFHTWKDWQSIFNFVHLVVFSRNGQRLVANEEVQAYVAQSGIDIVNLDMPALDITSSRVREILRQRPIDAAKLSSMLAPKVIDLLLAEPNSKD